MAAGKSTLSRELASQEHAVLLVPANARRQRAWFRRLIDEAGAEHEIHFIDASDTLRLRQLRHRSQDLPAESRWSSEAEFPVRHERG